MHPQSAVQVSKMTGSMQSLKFPFEITPVAPELNAKLLQYFHGEKDGFVQVGPEKYFFPLPYVNEAERYYNFQARPDDVWVVTVPRSGTTWTQELVWLVANNLDFDTARRRFLTERFPFLEFPLFIHPDLKTHLLRENAHDAQHLKFIEAMCEPGHKSLNKIGHNCRRFIKSHFPFSLLPPSIMKQQCKLIYVARQPKNVAVSYFHLNRLFRTQNYVGEFERFWRYFAEGLTPWMPYHSHIKEALAHRHLPNVLYLQYEDMVQDLGGAIDRVADFLGCPISVGGRGKLISHLSIENFRNNQAVNMSEMERIGMLNKGEPGFVRLGGVSGVPREFKENATLSAKADRWVAENELRLQHEILRSSSRCKGSTD